MKLQEQIGLNDVYRREEDFSADLAGHLAALEVGAFEDAETESPVGTRRADIVAQGDSGILVVENQIGKADWDHWGRLEAYARLKEADVAVLIAEDFEELMIVTCSLRNEDSEISWYLIKVEVTSHKELSFHKVSFPAIDIQTERKNTEYSEFWEPIRASGLFAGRPVPIRDEGWIGKGIRGVAMELRLRNHSCSIRLATHGESRFEKQAKVVELLEANDFKYEIKDATKSANIILHVLDKGKHDREDWPVIREKLTGTGKLIYELIDSSDV